MYNNKKVIGIICECNPFHKGHKRLINEAKKYGDIIIAVMSGDFVQRGEPSVYDKYYRTKKLLNNKVDIVIELPIEYALSSAKYFAKSAISILNKLQFVDNIIFGSKLNNIEILKKISKINPSDKNIDINSLLKNGNSYPKAIEEIYGIKLSPNDILGVEYIRAINDIKSKIIPICIKRKNDLPTATSLRKKIKRKITENSFSDLLTYKIYDTFKNNQNFEDISTVTKDLSNAMLNTANLNISLKKRAKLLNTKNRTLANIKRAFFNIIFDIKKKEIEKQNHGEKIDYIRILGIKKEALPLLQNIKVPFTISYSPKALNSCQNKFKIFNPSNKSTLTNIYATDLYNLLSNNKKIEATQKALII